MAMDSFRAQMPVTKSNAYFDHAAVAPLPQATLERMHWYIEDASQNGDKNWMSWSSCVSSLRSGAARLLNANKSEIALVSNTTQGINLVAEGFPWKSGDNLVIPANEFPSNLLPWRNLARRGVELRTLVVPASGEISLSDLTRLIDDRTRLVSLSWVGFSSGYRVDLGAVSELVHRRGALLFVDAIQGLGAFPLDVRAADIDFLAADGHKWMLGPEGAGLLYIREPLLEVLTPLMLGWNSLAADGFNPNSIQLKETASRYEGGATHMAGMLGFDASLSMLLEMGCHNSDSPVATAILENIEELAEKLRRADFTVRLPEEPKHRSGIVGVEWTEGDPMAARKHCIDNHVILSVRAGRIRISAHAYNDSDDIDRLVSTLISARDQQR